MAATDPNSTHSRTGDPGEKRDLDAIVGDGIAYSVMVGIGESYLPAFALAAGHGDLTAGLVATLPMLAGSFLQLVTPAAVRRLDSHRRWVVLCAGVQAASFLPLVVAALTGRLPLVVLYGAAALYWGAGMATSPAWNAWVETLVPASIRVRFFAGRARVGQAATLAGLALGGILLEVGRRHDLGLPVFAVLFLLAGSARVVSARFLAAQSEPRPIPLRDTAVSPAAFGRHLASEGHGRLLIFLLSFQLAVWIAAPFFTPLMLGPLGLSYTTFTALTGAAFLARVVALPALGRFGHRFGARSLMRIGSLGIVPLPALWLVSDDLVWLFALQVLSGVCWAAFELATLLSFFEHIPHHSRTSVLSMFNLANAAALATGTLVGAAIFRGSGGDELAYGAVLLTSATARLLTLPLLRGQTDRPHPPEVLPSRVLTVRPSVGALERPILAGLPEEPEAGGR